MSARNEAKRLFCSTVSSDEGDFSVEGEGEDAATAEMNEEVVVEEEAAVCSQSKMSRHSWHVMSRPQPDKQQQPRQWWQHGQL